MSDDESAVQVKEQSQQQPQVSRPSENSPELPARNDEEDPRDIDYYWIHEYDYPYWLDEDSEDGEQNQQQPQVSRASENSPDLPARNDDNRPRAYVTDRLTL